MRSESAPEITCPFCKTRRRLADVWEPSHWWFGGRSPSFDCSCGAEGLVPRPGEIGWLAYLFVKALMRVRFGVSYRYNYCDTSRLVPEYEGQYENVQPRLLIIWKKPGSQQIASA